MRLVSVNVGVPQPLRVNGKTLATAILKQPVGGPIALRRHNLDGDQQGDRKVHGGPTKAVYLYPTHHYDFWRDELPGTALPWGSFGENFSADGLDENAVSIGDEFRIGSAVVVVTEPRLPCATLAARFGRSDLGKRFLASGRTGFYMGVAQEGTVEAGDAIVAVTKHPAALRVADVVRLHTQDRADRALLERASALEALPPPWRTKFQKRLERLP